jgi:GH18 family chitinase
MFRLLKASAAAAVALCCALSSAWAQTIVVTPGGSIQSAVNAATPGTTIQVQAGVYTQKVLFAGKSGASGRYITLKAAPGVTLRGIGLVPVDREGLITIRNSSYIKVEGFNVQDFSSSGGQTPCGILVEGSGREVHILHNTIYNIRNKSTCKGPCQESAHGLAVFGTGPQGITDLRLEGNQVYGNVLQAGGPLVVTGNVDRFKVLNNNVYDNKTSGFQGECAGCGATTRVRNGVVRGNTATPALTPNADIPDWVDKPEGYQAGAKVRYKGNIFIAEFWASEPGVGDPATNGWRLYDELYEVTSTPLGGPAKVIGYLPTWRKAEGFNYKNDELYRNVTHSILSFLMFSETNLGEFDPKSVADVKAILRDVLVTGHKNGTYVSIALGGAVDYGFLYLMERIGRNPSDPVLQKAVYNVVSYVEANGLDGVDLDLECWWDKNGNAGNDQGGRLKSDGPHAAGKGLAVFAKELRKAMPGKLISAAVFATSWYGNCYDPELAEHVDWLGIMTYDLTGSWNLSPVGPQTALRKIRTEDQEAYAAEQQGPWPGPRGGTSSNPMVDNAILSVEDALWYWTNPYFSNWQGRGQKLPRNKIAAGVPIYGYDFAYGKDPDDLSGQVPPGYKAIRYKDLLTQFPQAATAAKANIKVPGNTPRPPFVAAAGSYPYAHNIYFETPGTAVEKLNFLKNAGAQGVIIWELSNDVWEEGKSIIKALYQNSGNPASRPPLPTKPGPEEEGPGGAFPWQLVKNFPEDWQYGPLTAAAANRPKDTRVVAQAVEAKATDEEFVGITASPAVAVYDNKLYCFREGKDKDGWLWYTYFERRRGLQGEVWAGDTQTSFGITGTPAVAEYQGKLHIVHQGRKEDGRLWHLTFDGTNWSEDTRLPFESALGSRDRHSFPTAALVVYRDILYCVHEGKGDGWLWVASFDGINWSEDKKLPFGTSGGPALAVVDDRLLCMHEGRGEDGWLWYTQFDGSTWSDDRHVDLSDNGWLDDENRRFPNGQAENISSAAAAKGSTEQWVGTSGAPTILVRRSLLSIMHQGRGEDGKIWVFNKKKKGGENGEEEAEDIWFNVTGGISGIPAVAEFNGEVHILHNGQEPGTLWALRQRLARPSVEYFDLSLPERPSAPYMNLPNYSADLRRARAYQDEEHPVSMARHHIVPDNLLRNFWNTLLERGHFNGTHGVAERLLVALEARLPRYARDSMRLEEGDVSELQDLLTRIINGEIQHRAGARRPNGFDNLSAVYQWMPGNLFIGPRGGGGPYQRDDDPGDGFEGGARVLMSNQSFQTREQANRYIREYINNQSTTAAARAITALTDIANVRTIPFRVNDTQWLLSRNRTYSLRPARDEL